MIRDLYDNSIVAYKTATEQTVRLVLNTIRIARAKEKITEKLHLHSDQGFQYTSQAYYELTKAYRITPSMSRRGNCYNNSMAENFFACLKTECIYRQKIQTIQQARTLMITSSFITTSASKLKQNWRHWNCGVSFNLNIFVYNGEVFLCSLPVHCHSPFQQFIIFYD